MEELKNKIIQLRKKTFSKEFCVGYDQKEEDALRLEIQEMMKEEPNKQELFRIWTNEFQGISLLQLPLFKSATVYIYLIKE